MSHDDNSIAESAARKTARENLLYPSVALARAMVKAALDPIMLTKLKRGSPLALIVLAPYPEAVADIADALANMSDVSARVVHTESARDVANLAGVAGAAGGVATVHVASDLRFVPSAYRDLSERIVRIPRPDGSILRRAMSSCCMGRPPMALARLDVSRLDWKLLCAMMPRGGRASVSAKAFARLVGVAPEPDALPTLEASLEYGEARDWGLSLARDLAAWRRGDIPASDLRSAILLSGPPGVGKSYFARVLAKTLGVRLVVFGVGELFRNGGYLNETLKTLRSAFAEAAIGTPGVLFLDELDSFPMRASGDKNDAYFNALVNELLLLLDSANRPPGLVVVGATNLPETIDPAIKRSGRLSTHVRISLPDVKGLEHVMRVHLQNDLQGVSLTRLARKAVGATPADVAEWIMTARSSARDKGRAIEIGDIERCISAGDERTPEEMFRVAVHEAGHVLADMMAGPGRKPAHVSIVMRNDTFGHVVHSGLETLVTERSLVARLRILLGGLAAEEVVFGKEDLSGGAGGGPGSDLAKATVLASTMAGSFGMRGSLVYVGSEKDMLRHLRYDREMRFAVNAELAATFETVKDHLRHRKVGLVALALALVGRGVLSGEEVEEILNKAERPDSTAEIAAIAGNALMLKATPPR